MADLAERAEFHSARRRVEQPLARSASRHTPLQRLAAARGRGYGALLAARPAGPCPIQRVAASAQPIQLMRPHISDVGRDFQIHYPGPHSGPIIGSYLGPGEGDTYRFQTSSRVISVAEDRILGYRPTVGGMHPRGQIRPPEENLEGRDQIFLSEADLSGAMARQRRDPGLLDRMAVTTFEETPDYESYEQNRRDLEGQGVPIINSMDLSKVPESAERLSRIGENANLHFQMPRVPRNVSGYSTQKLIQDTLRLPGKMERSDLSVTVTTPHPESYGKKGVHERFYGLEGKKNAIKGTGMNMDEAIDDPDSGLETYGYVHKQSTIDQSAEVAKKRKRYKFTPRHTEHDDFKHKDFKKDEDEDDKGEGGGFGGGLGNMNLVNEMVF